MKPNQYGEQSNQPIYNQPPSLGQLPPQIGAQGSNSNPTTYRRTNPMGAAPQPVVCVPPPTLFGGMQFIYVQDPMTELATCPSLLIRQEPELFEAFTGCEQPNIYHVFGNSPLGFRYLFKCLEKSTFCQRRFCPSEQREFNMDIIHCSSVDQLGMGFTTPFATMMKPFMCTCCCLCRPEISVLVNSTGQPAGKVKYIYTFCDPTFEVYNIVLLEDLNILLLLIAANVL